MVATFHLVDVFLALFKRRNVRRTRVQLLQGTRFLEFDGNRGDGEMDPREEGPLS